MKIIVSVVVYNRIENIKRWVKCWSQCDQQNAELVIIHNYYGDQKELEKFKSLCEQNKIKYIPRNGTGYDIGAFQDVCRQRLEGFPDFDYLLWCCDDTIPMQKDFLRPFIEAIEKQNVGLSCMQISKSTPGSIWHVRTTGFMISKETSLRLSFPADPIKTKQECYLFEHRGGKNTLCEQIRAMGKDCVQVTQNATSPLWDMGYWKRLDRINEHNKVFGFEENRGDKVVFICPIFNMYPQIISSLLCQTHKNWELLLIHNGPCDNNLKQVVSNYKDKRVKFIEYQENTGSWGHKLRNWALEELRENRLSENAAYVVITNADNYHAPVFTEYLIRGFKRSHTAVATYCDSMVHNYKDWQVIPVKFEKGYIDCAGVMVKKEIATEVGWRDTDSHSSDWTYFSDIASRYSPRNFIPVRGCLLMHN